MRALLLATLLAAGAAAAQDFPQRPIRMVIPFPAGGSIDVIGRAIAQPWSAALGQQIVIDNRGGAGGTLGSELVAKAQPDGYTILYGNSGPLPSRQTAVPLPGLKSNTVRVSSPKHSPMATRFSTATRGRCRSDRCSTKNSATTCSAISRRCRRR